MRPAFVLLPSTIALTLASTAGAYTSVSLTGVGPLKLGMSQTAALKTGWLSNRQNGCELASPRPVDYAFKGAKAPAKLAGSAEFTSGKLTNLSFTRGAKTTEGVIVKQTTLKQMAAIYKAKAFSVMTSFEPAFQATFVTASKGGEVKINGVGSGKLVSQLGIPFVPVCE